jgi:ATP-dependent protease ClpP protease subunit
VNLAQLLSYPTHPLCTQINEDSIAKLTKWISENHDQSDITILLNSGGGIVSLALGAYDTVRLMTEHTNIYIVATGRCQSAASILLFAADPDKRFATPEVRFMTHSVGMTVDGTRYPCVEDVTPELIKEMGDMIGADLQEAYDLQEILIDLTKKETNISDDDARRLFSAEGTYFSAARACEFGFVSRVLTRSSRSDT